MQQLILGIGNTILWVIEPCRKGKGYAMRCIMIHKTQVFFSSDLQSLPDGIVGKIPLTQVIYKLEYDYEVIYPMFDYSFVFLIYFCSFSLCLSFSQFVSLIPTQPPVKLTEMAIIEV
jgi:hypothetical protein